MNNSIVFQASISQLSKMMNWIRTQLKNYSVNDERGKQIQLALEEALVNVIHYAYPHPPGLIEIRIAFNKKTSELDFTILDQGVPFNPIERAAADITSSLTEREPGGLGIFFIKKVSDDVNYNREGDSNVLRIRNEI